MNTSTYIRRKNTINILQIAKKSAGSKVILVFDLNSYFMKVTAFSPKVKKINVVQQRMRMVLNRDIKKAPYSYIHQPFIT